MKIYISILLLLVTFFQSLTTYAHPGNTDGNGGHTCRTNCPKWGLNYGEYHYHYDDSSSSSSSSSYDSTIIDEEIKIMSEQEYNDGYSLGLSQGKLAYQNSQSYEYYMDYGYGTDEYYNGHKKGFEDGFEKAKIVATIEKGKEEGYSDGLNLLDTKKTYTNIEVQNAYDYEYRKGFDIANENVFQEGFEQANQLAPLKDFSNKSDLYIKIYKDGYEKGYNDKLIEVEKEGYNSAFTNNSLIIPPIYESSIDAKTYYINGFESNKISVSIKSQAYEDGFWFIKNDKETQLDEYNYAKEIYSYHYHRGKEAALDLYKKVALVTSSASAVLIIPITFLLVRKKSN